MRGGAATVLATGAVPMIRPAVGLMEVEKEPRRQLPHVLPAQK